MSSDYIRIIDPSEIKVGMVIEWGTVDDFIVRCEVKSIRIKRYFIRMDYCVNDQESDLGYILGGADVKVIREPDITQPEEPTNFGACVVVSGIRFIRYMTGPSGVLWRGYDDSVADWSEICNLGQVKVVNKDPFSELEQ